jgi:hypothetical protein
MHGGTAGATEMDRDVHRTPFEGLIRLWMTVRLDHDGPKRGATFNSDFLRFTKNKSFTRSNQIRETMGISKREMGQSPLFEFQNCTCLLNQSPFFEILGKNLIRTPSRPVLQLRLRAVQWRPVMPGTSTSTLPFGQPER